MAGLETKPAKFSQDIVASRNSEVRHQLATIEDFARI
jgi:hypothetical protein